MVRKIFAVVTAFGLLAQEAAFAKQTASVPRKQVQLSWEELAGFVVEQKVSLALPDGARLQGEVLAVRPESLVLDIQKSSQKKVHPKGQAEIPRSSVTEMQIIRERSAGMRIACGILGALGGLFAVGGLAYVTDSVGVLVPGLLL